MRITGAEALIKSLEMEGVDVLFGYPGGVVLPIYDALFDCKTIRHVLVRHEQCAGHAADAYARATGKVGVCLVTSGPGATNLVTGLANAWMDSTPMVAITGQVATNVLGTDAFQEADITGITLPITKHSYLVKDVSQLPTIIREAFQLAKSGRPGPVLIDMPVDMSKAEIDFKYPEDLTIPGYKPTYKGHAKQIKEAAKLLAGAHKPIIYAGGGITHSEAWDELRKLAETVQIPVTTTLMGKGVFPDDHDLSLRMLGMHGTRYANYAIMDSDVILAIGVRFDDRVTGKVSTFAPHATIIHVDIDPAEISKNVRVDVPIVGDAKTVLKDLVTAVQKIEQPHGDKTKWHELIARWKEAYPLHYHQNGVIRPEYVVDTINKVTKGRETIITTGVGQNQMWAAQFYSANTPRGFITSGGLGTMGFGLPAAVGAQVGKPDSVVIDIDGDGSIQMVSQELATVAANKLPIIIAILNNRFLGMVRQWQELFYDHRYSSVDLDVGTPDFVKLAEAYGIKGVRVEKIEDVEPTLKEAIEARKPILIDFMVAREENVYPMVAPGASIDEMLGGIPGASLSQMIDEEVEKRETHPVSTRSK
ncbi:MAG: acetolactate synthase, large subunit, biosynthetic type [Candidatus Aquicultor secundus]|nr:biosynthetic-type acetolactate synthase large subunit [Candidatus Aquicultor secundus]NCO66442.1 biosynthetic-type acetolactate synthase large subunit [Solirubrobacter sp.]OIO85723.1 MAG: acetolactate synthase, large subunit, biosynthetic type [Candidatus Aquicultor secundus]PIU26771.1 MAG: acetolactate synthase, large subunit, biosynthetic type [Candidatus Aquicultor secundus]PIY37356.1 MAG: acetolactate synthase, large subunit, biosynthetic type [Candidatus Aquicultor secundus]PJB76910.1 